MAEEEDKTDAEHKNSSPSTGLEGGQADTLREKKKKDGHVKGELEEPIDTTSSETRWKQPSETPSAASTSASSVSVKQEDLKQEENEDVKARRLPQQGIKRKGESDERRIDAGATNALMLSDLHWWTTEDDIRGWANECGVEDEIKGIVFSEHKANGKSKGQAYVEFASPQASTALRHKIEAMASGQSGARRYTAAFTNAAHNPFKTLPKDAPARAKEDRSQRAGSIPYSGPMQAEYRGNSGFRGRGGYRGRAGGDNNNFNHQNNYNNPRSFSGPINGMAASSMNANPNFPPAMQMMNNFNPSGFNGGFNTRGGAGIGGRGGAMNGMVPMPLNIQAAMMGMNPMMAGMGPQGFANAQFNPAMFGQGSMNAMNVGEWGHGSKRQRQD